MWMRERFVVEQTKQCGCHACDDSRPNADDVYSTVLMFLKKSKIEIP